MEKYGNRYNKHGYITPNLKNLFDFSATISILLYAPPLCHTHLENSTLHQAATAFNCRYNVTMVFSSSGTSYCNSINIIQYNFFLFLMLPIAMRFKLKPLQGFIIQLLLISLGLLLTWQKDIRHDRNWYGNYYRDDSYLVVRIEEPLVEKINLLKQNTKLREARDILLPRLMNGEIEV